MRVILAIEIPEGRDPARLASDLEAAFARGAAGAALAGDLGLPARPRLECARLGGDAISAAESRGLAWWVDWTAEDMGQRRHRTAEMERGGEIGPGALAAWDAGMAVVTALAARLRR